MSLFHVALVAHSRHADIDFEGVVGKPASFEIAISELGKRRVWSGVCNDIQLVRAEVQGLSTYEISIVPDLWLATQRRNYRVFQGMSEPDMVRQILSEWGIKPEVRLRETYRKRAYRVQYGESDFAFLSRMLEDAGVSFHFDTEGAATTLVLDDAPQSRPVRAPSLPFRDNPTATDREHVTVLRAGRRVRPGNARGPIVEQFTTGCAHSTNLVVDVSPDLSMSAPPPTNRLLKRTTAPFSARAEVVWFRPRAADRTRPGRSARAPRAPGPPGCAR